MKYLDQNGLLYLWSKVKTLVPTKTSQLTNDSGFLTSHQDISGKLDKTGDGANVTSTFTQASNRVNIATGEKLSTMFGKISKWFADLKTVAFTGAYSDLSGRPMKVSEFTNDSGFQNASQVESAITGKGYQTSSDVESAIVAKGYQTASQVESAITEKGYQTESQVNAIVVSKGYQTAQQVTTAINNAISDITGISFEVVSTLPTTGDVGKIYLISNGGANPNIYDEYIWITSDAKFEKIGTTDVDLSGYAKTSDFVSITNAEIDTITA